MAKSLEKLVVLRHGQYEQNGDLSTTAEDLLREQAKKIKEIFGSDLADIVIISSQAKRALQSAAILVYALGINVEVCAIPVFGDERGIAGNLNEIWDYFATLATNRNVIVITHEDAVVSMAFATEILNGLNSTLTNDIWYCTGFFADITNDTLHKLSY
jgi:broad specificity phosphatase PhoE